MPSTACQKSGSESHLVNDRIAIVEAGARIPESLAAPDQHIIRHDPDESLGAFCRRLQARLRKVPGCRRVLLLLGPELSLRPRLQMLSLLAGHLIASAAMEVEIHVHEGPNQHRLGWRILESSQQLKELRNIPLRLRFNELADDGTESIGEGDRFESGPALRAAGVLDSREGAPTWDGPGRAWDDGASRSRDGALDGDHGDSPWEDKAFEAEDAAA